ncbi:uncharacterized protein TrAFT101_010940 [Trichoderma asperellum]|nr:hypothetical protein TrAFT101_010940 [Trichoderma asperellum]
MDSSSMSSRAFQKAPAQYPRASSRASNRSASTRMTAQGVRSPVPGPRLAPSPQLSIDHPSHRYHHSPYKEPVLSPRSTPKPTPQASREGSVESPRTQAVSSFLQEKLQRERRAEVDKLSQSSLSRVNEDFGVPLSISRINSPRRRSIAASSDGSRPKSSSGNDPAKKPGLGVKDMDNVISRLHKENFDLKLELYHRREKQSTLESSIESLEKEKRQTEEMNETLLDELEKRDKAVEEAVAMIVMLEAKVDQLLQERNMVLQVEQERFFCRQDMEQKYLRPSLDLPADEAGKQVDGNRAINRVPSFLSEKSENTENLRNVYLGVRGSALSLARVTEGNLEVDNGATNGPAPGSPTLSVLSESSFASVYGKKGQESIFPPPVDQPLSLDGLDADSQIYTAEGRDVSKRITGFPPRAASANHFNGGSRSAAPRHPSISGSVGHASPLQQIEQLARSQSVLQEGFHPVANSSRDRRRSQPPPTLRKVMTDGPGTFRLHDPNFPPTPDTISTSTLHRMRSSNDSLTRQDSRNDRASVVYSDQDNQSLRVSFRGKQSQLRGVDKGAGDENGHSYGIAVPMPQQHHHHHQRAASESTTSRKKDNQWDSTDSDEQSDSHSPRSSLDIWMRESNKPTRDDNVSSDMFNFPPGFGHQKTQSQGIGNDADYINDLFSLRQSLVTNTAPPPPGRRSSLHARTSSTTSSARNSPRTLTLTSTPEQPEHPEELEYVNRSRQRSNSVQVKHDYHTPIQSPSIPQLPNSEKRNHYPPVSGPRTALNRLFRRSVAPTSPSSMPASATETTFSESFKSTQGVSLQPWMNRNIGSELDPRAGSTPPPITLTLRQRRRNTVGTEAAPSFIPSSTSAPVRLSETAVNGRNSPAARKLPAEPATPAASVIGTRRKWLPGFSRGSSSLRNRAT